MTKPTMQPNEISEVLNRPMSQELLARDVARLGYVAKDGTPRTIPIGFTWNGAEIVMCTTKNAPKLTALRHNPAVALTIDTEVHPPKILLIRGRQAGVAAYPHRFRHHFSHTWLDRGGPEGDLMELYGWTSPQMLRRYGASARSARARRTYDRIMTGT